MDNERFEKFGSDVQGQGLSEYSLLVAFLTMLGLALFLAVGGNTQNIWSMSTSRLVVANTTTSTAAPASAPASTPER